MFIIPVLSEMQNSLAEMKTYMKQMDEELVDSAVGKSFPMKKQTRAAPKVETILKVSFIILKMINLA